MKKTAKDVPVPERPGLEMVREDYHPIRALFGPEVKFEDKVNRMFWAQLTFCLVIFGLGIFVGYLIWQ